MTTQFQITREQALRIEEEVGSPCFVYDEATLRATATATLAFPNAFGLIARYAMKASPNGNLLRLFAAMGMHIDASSGYEVLRALDAGIEPQNISLSTQELPLDFAELISKGVSLNACSLHQLREYGKRFPGKEVGVRFNPGLGSGGTNRTNVGGPASSFGVWHEQADEVQAIADEFDLKIFRIHSHIGSGSDPEVWVRVVDLNFDLVRRFPGVTHLNLGGGYKVGRVEGEHTTDFQTIGEPMMASFKAFAEETGREIHLEVEPGTYLVANACAILSKIQDVASTGGSGYEFLKLNTGMTDNTRPSMYGSQHPMEVIPADGEERGERDYIVVGHCCESGDILTPAPGDSEALAPRRLKEARIGDFFVIGAAGAYCASMAAKNYNSFPESAECLIRLDGSIALLRHRQPPEQIFANETRIEFS